MCVCACVCVRACVFACVCTCVYITHFVYLSFETCVVFRRTPTHPYSLSPLSFRVQWDASELPRHVTLAVRAISKRACFNLQIAPLVMNTGEFTWTLTSDILPSDDYQVIVSAVVGDREVAAISPRFSVVSSPSVTDSSTSSRPARSCVRL